MSPRDVVRGMLRRPRLAGSVLPEPSPVEVYEGRLPQPSALDLGLGEAKARPVSAPVAYAPWCPECRQEPVGGPWTLQGAEYLARIHDGLWHHAAWTARALPAEEVARLAAGAGGREAFRAGAEHLSVHGSDGEVLEAVRRVVPVEVARLRAAVMAGCVRSAAAAQADLDWALRDGWASGFAAYGLATGCRSALEAEAGEAR